MTAARPATAAEIDAMPVVDCDIHPMLATPDAFDPYLSTRWRAYLRDYGQLHRQPFVGGSMYPKSAPALSRRDAWPPTGGPPGSDLAFMREQHLNPNNIEFGVLQLLYPNTRDERNPDLAVALCSAANDWQLAEWTEPEPRLKASLVIPAHDTDAALREIDRRADDRSFAQIFLTARAVEPVGSRRYWPLYAAAVEHDLPIGMHSGGTSGLPVSAAGWPSFYLEEHQGHTLAFESTLVNLVFSGVFEAFPDLRFVAIESSFAFAPSLAWHLDTVWERQRRELPHLSMRPSEYLRRNVWFTTQPIEEPERPADLLDVLEWVGHDRLLFSSDYPHWDNDDPRHAFTVPLPAATLSAILAGNARTVYRLA